MSDKKSILIHLPEEVKRKLKIEAAQEDQPLKVFIEDMLTSRVAGKKLKSPKVDEVVVEPPPTQQQRGSGSY